MGSRREKFCMHIILVICMKSMGIGGTQVSDPLIYNVRTVIFYVLSNVELSQVDVQQLIYVLIFFISNGIV